MGSQICVAKCVCPNGLAKSPKYYPRNEEPNPHNHPTPSDSRSESTTKRKSRATQPIPSKFEIIRKVDCKDVIPTPSPLRNVSSGIVAENCYRETLQRNTAENYCRDLQEFETRLRIERKLIFRLHRWFASIRHRLTWTHFDLRQLHLLRDALSRTAVGACQGLDAERMIERMWGDAKFFCFLPMFDQRCQRHVV